MAATSLTPALQRLAKEGASCLGAPVEHIEPGQLIRRPFSDVLRARVITARGEQVVYCKTFRSPAGDPTSFERLRFRVEREFRETARAYQAFAGQPGFAPLEPVALYPDLLALVTKEVDGEPFSDLLARTSRRWSRGDLQEAVRAAALIGQWLRTYQLAPAEPQRLSITDLREYVDSRLARLERERVAGFAVGRREQIVQEFDAWASRLESSDLDALPVHADFCPENILVHKGAISVIDFAMAKRGLRHLDLSHLLIHLDFRRGRTWKQDSLAAIRRSLLDGFGDPGVTESPGFRLAVLVHVAALMADRLNRASRLRAAKNLWLAPQIRRCLEFVHA
ncbi:MAG: phosphotransferase [Acidobacteriota bacterium]